MYFANWKIKIRTVRILRMIIKGTVPHRQSKNTHKRAMLGGLELTGGAAACPALHQLPNM